MLERVKKVIAGQAEVEISEIELNNTFEELGIDSLALFELIIALEEEFGIVISDQDAEDIATVGDAVKYIESKCS